MIGAYEPAHLPAQPGGYAILAWSVLSVPWTLACALGLLSRRPWGRTLARLYWMMTALTVVLLPIAVYGLYGLSRPRVIAQFANRGRQASGGLDKAAA